MSIARRSVAGRCVACHRQALERSICIDLPERLNVTCRKASRPYSTGSLLKSPHSRRPVSASSQSRRWLTSSQRSEDLETPQNSEQPPEHSPSTIPSLAERRPWYLEEEKADTETNPFAHRQRIPALPADPPPMLSALLKYLSVEIGLDYLQLLDLRLVDPPPAFGANLFMIFGTARSEKHLNVSADRLCRWLRSDYGLSPYADGLLGRQELKLKLRRKARRSKMLSAAGATNPSSLQMDDGTRTGWVCVNVSGVPLGANTESETGPSDFVGFGTRSEDAKIVIQMLTEEKRVELDLEALWQEVVRRSTVRQKAQETESVTEVPGPPTNALPRTRQLPSNAFTQQIRHIHSSSGHQRPSKGTPPILGSHPPHNSRNVEPAVPEDTASHDQEGLLQIIKHLESMDRDLALMALGVGQEDRSSTSLLKNFFAKMPLFADGRAWYAHLSLHRIGMSLGHPNYTAHGHWQLLKEMDASCVPIPQSIFVAAASTVLSGPVHHIPQINEDDYVHEDVNEGGQKTDYASGVGRLHAEKHFYMAFDIIERMEAHGHETLPLRFFIELNRFIMHVQIDNQLQRKSPEYSFFSRKQREHLQQQFLHSIRLLYPLDKPLPTGLSMDIMKLLGEKDYWHLFHKFWRSIALEGFSRPAELYATFFTAIAKYGKEAPSRYAVDYWVPEMAREKRPVQMDSSIAIGVLGCLRNMGFDPRADEHGHLFRHKKLWDECWEMAQMGDLSPGQSTDAPRA